MTTTPTGTTINSQERIVVAMSGGVDSSAAALLLAEAGYPIVGVAMQVWDYRNHGGNSSRATCCAPADFDDARTVATAKDFPFYVFDFEESFEEAVINPFVQSYLSGSTPNPCIECNRRVKFKELRRRAAALGAQKVATGHYAQIKPVGDRLGLFTSHDKRKDQSYFLYALTQAELAATVFPVGAMTKDQVRDYLRSRELEIASKAESQDICFVSGAVSDFVEKKSGVKPARGDVVTRSGEKIGEHDGIHGFTVGQRRGLGIAEKHPLYVLSIDAESNTIEVGSEDQLREDGFALTDVNWISGEIPREPFLTRIKVRYRHPGVLCEVKPVGESEALVTFVEGWSAASPGQAAVFYSIEPDSSGDYQVYGGGTITKRRKS